MANLNGVTTALMASMAGAVQARDRADAARGLVGYGHGPPSKRRRTDYATEMPLQKASEIADQRVTPQQALKLDCDFITVTVGQAEPKASFKVHEDAICDRSEFFRSAMKPEWASMREDPRTIDLPEDDPDAFSLYRTWLYSGKLAIMPPAGSTTASDSNFDTTSLIHDNNDESQHDNDPDSHYHTLAYAYVLGERLLDKDFKNAIADSYVLYARGNPPAKRYYPSNEEIRILYDGTGEGSPIRQLLVDIWYCRGKMEWIDKDADLPREFCTNVLRELFRLRQEGRDLVNLSRPWKLSHMQYHEK